MFNNSQFEIIEDWKDYDQSLLSTYAAKYYQSTGSSAYARSSGSAIPSELTNCYPHAETLVKLLKVIHGDNSVTLLDLGTGSGLFAKHALIAAREHKLQLRVLLADISFKALEDIKAHNILKDFQEGSDYELLKANIFDLNDAKKLNGTQFKLDNLDAVSLNYFYDAMPMQVLRRHDQGYQKLQFRLAQDKNQTIPATDINFLRSLFVEERWVDYDLSQETNPIKKQYLDLLTNCSENPHGNIYFNYGSLFATEILLQACSDKALIYAADMPNNFNLKTSFQIYGNGMAHHLNTELLNLLIKKLNYHSWTEVSPLLQRMIYCKDKDIFKQLKEPITELFINNDNVLLYADLRNALTALYSHYSHKTYKFILDQLLEIDSHSQFSYWARARYYQMLGDTAKSELYTKQAQAMDFLGLV